MGRPRKQQEPDVYVAVDDGIWTSPDGTEYTFHTGLTTVRRGHELLKAMGSSFKPLDVTFDADTERWHGEETEVRVA